MGPEQGGALSSDPCFFFFLFFLCGAPTVAMQRTLQSASMRCAPPSAHLELVAVAEAQRLAAHKVRPLELWQVLLVRHFRQQAGWPCRHPGLGKRQARVGWQQHKVPRVYCRKEAEGGSRSPRVSTELRAKQDSRCGRARRRCREGSGSYWGSRSARHRRHCTGQSAQDSCPTAASPHRPHQCLQERAGPCVRMGASCLRQKPSADGSIMSETEAIRAETGWCASWPAAATHAGMQACPAGRPGRQLRHAPTTMTAYPWRRARSTTAGLVQDITTKSCCGMCWDVPTAHVQAGQRHSGSEWAAGHSGSKPGWAVVPVPQGGRPAAAAAAWPLPPAACPLLAVSVPNAPWPTWRLNEHVGHIGTREVQVLAAPRHSQVVAHPAVLDQRVDCVPGREGSRGGASRAKVRCLKAAVLGT